MLLCLIVEDDELSCYTYEKTLATLGIKTVTTSDGAEALQFCRTKMPDLILLDMKMPTMDGFTFIKELHQMLNGKSVKVIACTGLHDMDTVQKLKSEGIAGYLVKPFTMDLMIEKIKKLHL